MPSAKCGKMRTSLCEKALEIHQKERVSLIEDIKNFTGYPTLYRVLLRWLPVLALFDVIAIFFLLMFSGIIPITYASEAPRDYIEAPTLPETAETDYYRSHLTERQVVIYDTLEDAYRSFIHVIDLPDGTTEEDVKIAMAAVQADNPDIFWVNTDYYRQSEIWGLANMTISYLYDDPAEVRAKIAEYEARADEIIASVEWMAGEEATDSDKAKELYWWIATNIEYEESDGRDQHICSAFDDGYTVCAGYAKVTKYLCDRMGIPCLYIAGGAFDEIEDSSSGNHAWNVLELDGDTVYWDVTWGDEGDYADWHWFDTKYSTFHVSHTARYGEYFDRPEWADGNREEEDSFTREGLSMAKGAVFEDFSDIANDITSEDAATTLRVIYNDFR